MNDTYRLGYRWVVDGPIETVFHYVSDARTFPRWFPVFEEVLPEDPTGPIRVGTRARLRVRALLPYTLDWHVTVVRHEPPHLTETDCRVVLGRRFAMRGRIRFRLVRDGERTVVFNEQEMISERPLPRFLRPLAQAAFSINHRWAMARGLPGLRRVVGERGRSAGAGAFREAPGPLL
jgi:uncharacterized protein YndB with AHSA1/START domain